MSLVFPHCCGGRFSYQLVITQGLTSIARQRDQALLYSVRTDDARQWGVQFQRNSCPFLRHPLQQSWFFFQNRSLTGCLGIVASTIVARIMRSSIQQAVATQNAIATKNATSSAPDAYLPRLSQVLTFFLVFDRIWKL